MDLSNDFLDFLDWFDWFNDAPVVEFDVIVLRRLLISGKFMFMFIIEIDMCDSNKKLIFELDFFGNIPMKNVLNLLRIWILYEL